MIRGRYSARMGEPVRLYIRVYLNGQLHDPLGFGPITITRADNPQILVRFEAPIRESVGTYFVSWNVPSDDTDSVYYSASFPGSGSYSDHWSNIQISENYFTSRDFDFYVAPDDIESAEFSQADPYTFSYTLETPTFQRGTQDYLTIKVLEQNNRLVANQNIWPTGQIRLKKGNNIIVNWENALHKEMGNTYSYFLDTVPRESGIYQAQLKFDLLESITESPAVYTATASLRNGYNPIGRKYLVMETAGDKKTIAFISAASRASVTGFNRSWYSGAILLGDGIWSNLTTTSSVPASSFDIWIDGSGPHTVNFAVGNYTVQDAVDNINTELIAIDASYANTARKIYITGGWGIGLFSSTLGIGSTLKIDNFTNSLESAIWELTPRSYPEEHQGGDAEIWWTPDVINNRFYASVGTGGFQEVLVPTGVGYTADDIVTHLTYSPGTKSAFLESQNPIYTANIGGDNFRYTADGDTYELTFSGTNIPIDDIVGQINANSVTIPGGTPLAFPVASVTADSRVRLQSNITGVNSEISIGNGSANAGLFFTEGTYSAGSSGIDGVNVVKNEFGQIKISTVSTGSSAFLRIGDATNFNSLLNTTIGFPSTGAQAYGSNADKATLRGEDIADPYNITLTPYTDGLITNRIEMDDIATLPLDGETLHITVDYTTPTIITFEGNKSAAEIVGDNTLNPLVTIPFVNGVNNRLRIATKNPTVGYTSYVDIYFDEATTWYNSNLITWIRSRLLAAGMDADAEITATNKLRLYRKTSGAGYEIKIDSFDSEDYTSSITPIDFEDAHPFGTGTSGQTGTGDCNIILPNTVTTTSWPNPGLIFVKGDGGSDAGEFMKYHNIVLDGSSQPNLYVNAANRGVLENTSFPVIDHTHGGGGEVVWPKIGSTSNYMFGIKDTGDTNYYSDLNDNAAITNNGITAAITKAEIIDQINSALGTKAVATEDGDYNIRITSLNAIGGTASRILISDAGGSTVRHLFWSSDSGSWTTLEEVGGIPASGGVAPTNYEVGDSSVFNPSGGYVAIEGELFSYSGILTSPDRITLTGRALETTANVAHAQGVTIYSLDLNEVIGVNGNNRIHAATKGDITTSSWQTIDTVTGTLTISEIAASISAQATGFAVQTYLDGSSNPQPEFYTFANGYDSGWIAIRDDSTLAPLIGFNIQSYIETSTAPTYPVIFEDGINDELYLKAGHDDYWPPDGTTQPDPLALASNWILVDFNRKARLISPVAESNYIGGTVDNFLNFNIDNVSGTSKSVAVTFSGETTAAAVVSTINTAWTTLGESGTIAYVYTYNGDDHVVIESPYIGSVGSADILITTGNTDLGFVATTADSVTFDASGDVSYTNATALLNFINQEITAYVNMIKANDVSAPVDYNITASETGKIRISNDTPTDIGIGNRVAVSSLGTSTASLLLNFDFYGQYRRIGGGNIKPAGAFTLGYQFPNEFNVGVNAQPAVIEATGATYPVDVTDHINSSLVVDPNALGFAAIQFPSQYMNLTEIIDFINGRGYVYGVDQQWDSDVTFSSDTLVIVDRNGDHAAIALNGVLSLDDVVDDINNESIEVTAEDWNSKLRIKANDPTGVGATVTIPQYFDALEAVRHIEFDITVTGGTFDIGDTIKQSTTLAEGIISNITGTPPNLTLEVKVNYGTFVDEISTIDELPSGGTSNFDTGTLSEISGTNATNFVVGESVTTTPNSYTGTVTAWDSTEQTLGILEPTGDMTGETSIEGDTSGAIRLVYDVESNHYLSSANTKIGIPASGVISTPVGTPKFVAEAAWAYRSSYSENGQIVIESTILRSETQTSSIQIGSALAVTAGGDGSFANSLLGFNIDGVGPVFGLLGTGYSISDIIDTINSSFGGQHIASDAGNILRLTSPDEGNESYITIYATGTSDDIFVKFGLQAKTVYGSEQHNLAQKILSPYLQFTIV